MTETKPKTIEELKAAIDLAVTEQEYKQLSAELAKLEIAARLTENKARAEEAQAQERARSEALAQYEEARTQQQAKTERVLELDQQIYDLVVQLVNLADSHERARNEAAQAYNEAAGLAGLYGFDAPVLPSVGLWGMRDSTLIDALALYAEHKGLRDHQVALGHEMPDLDLTAIKSFGPRRWFELGKEINSREVSRIREENLEREAELEAQRAAVFENVPGARPRNWKPNLS